MPTPTQACPACAVPLSLFTPREATQHVNACLDAAPPSPSTIPPICAICERNLSSLTPTARAEHANRCADATLPLGREPTREPRRNPRPRREPPSADPAVRRLLRLLGLDRYAPVFAKEEVDLAALRLLQDHDFAGLRVPDAARRRIAAALQSVEVLARIRGDPEGDVPVEEDVVPTQQFRKSRLADAMRRHVPLVESSGDEFCDADDALGQDVPEGRSEDDLPVVRVPTPDSGAKRKLDRESSMSSQEQWDGLVSGGASLHVCSGGSSSSESLRAIERSTRGASQISLEGRLRRWLTRRERREMTRHRREMGLIRERFEHMRKRLCTRGSAAPSSWGDSPPREECHFEEAASQDCRLKEASSPECRIEEAGNAGIEPILAEPGSLVRFTPEKDPDDASRSKIGTPSPLQELPRAEGPSSGDMVSPAPDGEKCHQVSFGMPGKPPRGQDSPSSCISAPQDPANETSRSFAGSGPEPIDLTQNVSDDEIRPIKTPQGSPKRGGGRKDCIVVSSCSARRRHRKRRCEGDSSSDESAEIYPLSQRLNALSQAKNIVTQHTPFAVGLSEDETPSVASEEEVLNLIESDKENEGTGQNATVLPSENVGGSQSRIPSESAAEAEVLSLVNDEAGPSQKKPPSRLKRPGKASPTEIIKAIKEDTGLYDDILIMETVPFVRILKSVRESGVNVSKKVMTEFLQREGVSFKPEPPKDGYRATRYFKHLSTEME